MYLAASNIKTQVKIIAIAGVWVIDCASIDAGDVPIVVCSVRVAKWYSTSLKSLGRWFDSTREQSHQDLVKYYNT